MLVGMLVLMALQLLPYQLRDDLLMAARRGDAAATAAVLALGADPDSRHLLTGWTPLMAASYYGHVAVVQELLSAGANPNAVDKRRGTALMKAVALPEGDDLVSRKVQILKVLLAAGADPQRRDVLGGTAWESAMILEQSEFVDVFAAAGVRGVRETLLMEAIAAGDSAEVKSLLAAGVDINYHDEGGWTILGESALSGNVEFAQAALSRGARVNARNQKGFTALMIAASANHPDVVRALLSAGADAALRNDAGQTALDLASPECASLLPR